MDNLPKIYATCKAGCQWETVHRSDFEASASHAIQHVAEDGNYYLELGKEYKIFATKDASNQFTCSVNFSYTENGVTKTYAIAHENDDKYAESFVFRLLEASVNTDATEMTLVYELAGIRYTETISGTSMSVSPENFLYVSEATKVLLYNADATIVAEKGEKGEKGDKGDAGSTTLGAIYADFKWIMGDVSGGVPVTPIEGGGSNRITNEDILCLDCDIVLKQSTINRMGVWVYADKNGTSPQWKNWVTTSGDYTITAGTYFRVLVSYLSGVTVTHSKTKYPPKDYELYQSIEIYAADNATLNLRESTIVQVYDYADDTATKIAKVLPVINRKFKSINHRGYKTAPENTLAAYKLSKKNGFDFVEGDIAFTSDGIPVLLHDDTINRTARNADGSTIATTINIADITYEQALTYDFGIWKGSEYAGTKIPTFTEFMRLCRNLELHPYIEVKKALTTEQARLLVNIVAEFGMLDYVSWISSNYLNNFKIITSIYPRARVGMLNGGGALSWAFEAEYQAIKTPLNEVFLDVAYNVLNDTILQTCKELNIPIEVYGLDTAEKILALNDYVSGATTDSVVASKVLYDANIE